MPPIRHQKQAKKVRKEHKGPSRPVALRDLKWKPVEIPAMALASSSKGSRGGSGGGGGQARGNAPAEDDEDEEDGEGDDWDPFADLDGGADDFMGLQEVKGVGVKYQGTGSGAKKVEFYRLGDGEDEDEAAPVDSDGEDDEEEWVPAASDAEDQEEDKVTEAASEEPAAAASNTKKRKLDDAQPPTKKQQKEKKVAKEQAAQPADDEDSLAIPSGLFASFADNVDASSSSHAGPSSHLSDVRFDDRKLPQWPKAVLATLHPALKRAVLSLAFVKPTPVQASTLPLSLLPLASSSSDDASPRDVIALAQTGSGKTLAYALPILQRVLAQRTSIFQSGSGSSSSSSSSRPLQALIILPTRELALQVYEVFQKLVDAAAGQGGQKWVRIAPIVGGMSEERQWRLLRGRKKKGDFVDDGDDEGQQDDHHAEIIIGTVGRLWELCKSDDYLPHRLRDAQALVLDEADRLLEQGKFQELSSVLELLNDNDSRQTLLFSATLDATLQVNLTKSRAKVARMVKQSKGKGNALMVKLVEQVGFKDPTGPELVDLTVDAKVSESLKEGKVECLDNEKDLYLYYLLLRYPGTYLVFLNSIDSVRRLQPLLTNLGVQSFPLHGEMDQRTRLRSLDGFKKTVKPGASTTSVLLATDVAARGLDIPLVSHVVHFHLPRSADGYIHRSGRTARAGQSGLSLVLLAPSEKSRWTSLRKQLATPSSDAAAGQGIKDEVRDLPVLLSVLGRLKTRLRLARELDEARHRSRKEKAEDDWVRKMAEEAEIALDDDEDVDPDAPQARSKSGSKGKGKAGKNDVAATRRLEAELQHELAQDVVVRGVRRNFLTQQAAGGDAATMLRDLVQGTGHRNFVGLGRSTAEEDLEGGGGAGKKNKKAKKEWKEEGW